MNYLNTVFTLTNLYSEIEDNKREWKERIKLKWHESKSYPRKKKKRIRKELLLDWQIANWSPFQ